MSASLRPGQRQHETAAAARCQLGADGVSCAIAVRAAALQTGCSTASVHFSTLPARRSHFNLASATSHFYIAIPVRLPIIVVHSYNYLPPRIREARPRSYISRLIFFLAQKLVAAGVGASACTSNTLRWTLLRHPRGWVGSSATYVFRLPPPSWAAAPREAPAAACALSHCGLRPSRPSISPVRCRFPSAGARAG